MLSTILFGLIFTTSLLFPNHANALETQEDFTAEIATTYTIDIEGLATVTQNVTLENTTALAYPSTYVFDLQATRVKNIQVFGADGIIEPHEIEESDFSTRVTITFKDPQVGKGKQTTFTVTYLDLDVSQQIGKVLELNIPKLAHTESYKSYTVTLLVPKTFGDPEIVSPRSYTLVEDQLYSHLVFSNLSGFDRGITALFGTSQVFSVELSYALSNPTVTPIETQIVLPPDTNHQEIFIESLEPEPLQVNLDSDMNWIATYALKPKEEVTVLYKAKVVTYVSHQDTMSEDEPDFALYTRQQPYWPTQDESIVQLATSLATPQAIYDYIASTFHYDYARIDTQSTLRYGAQAAIEAPNAALCMEFADTFITLARAAGIPSRLLVGYAYRENTNIRPLSLVREALHAWPEYYDSEAKRWIPVDPTWTVTTNGVDYFNQLDYNHIVFAIQGVSSDAPLPAGMYVDEIGQSDIQVHVADITPQRIIGETAILTIPLRTRLGLGNHAYATVTNQSNVSWSEHPFTIFNSKSGEVYHQGNLELIPYETARLPFDLPFDRSTMTSIGLGYWGDEYEIKKDFIVIRYAGMAVLGLTITISLGYVSYRIIFRSRRVHIS